MKIFNLKSVLMVSGLLWVVLSFYWFADRSIQTSSVELANTNIHSAYIELSQKSQDLRFKLGQWAYNYQLVKTKGIDFDQDGFLASEFDDMYFFKFEDADLKTQWIKSKDMASAVVPKGLSSKLKQWSKEELLKKDYIYFAEKIKSKGSKVFFGFPISDEFMGEGVVLSSIDLDYVQLISPHLNVYLLDSKGRFLYHPQKEYIGQASGGLTQAENKSVTVKVSPLDSIGGELVYRNTNKQILAQTLWPTAVMMLGLFLIFAVLIFEIYMQAPLNIPNSLNLTQPNSDLEKDEYGTILKLNEVRELLNKMSLTASVLKGRLDLASNGELDKKLFEDIKMDFQSLDQTIDVAYRTSQIIDVEHTLEKNLQVPEVASEDIGVPGVVMTPVPGDGVSGFETKETNGSLGSLQEAAKILQDQGLDFDDSTDDLFGDFKDEDFDDLSFDSELIEIETTSDDETWDELLDLKQDEEKTEGVVFQQYLGPETEVNDWAKIIEELTEEINTVELKPTTKTLDKDLNPGG